MKVNKSFFFSNNSKFSRRLNFHIQNEKKPSLLFFFFLALFALCFSTVFFKELKLIAFAPFLAIVIQRKSFIQTLWIAYICGVFANLLNFDIRFGFCSLGYMSSAGLLYKLSRQYLGEHPLEISLCSALIGCLFSLPQLFFFFLRDKSLWALFKALFGNILLLPIDALYALVWFSLPLMIFNYIKKRAFS